MENPGIKLKSHQKLLFHIEDFQALLPKTESQNTPK